MNSRSRVIINLRDRLSDHQICLVFLGNLGEIFPSFQLTDLDLPKENEIPWKEEGHGLDGSMRTFGAIV